MSVQLPDRGVLFVISGPSGVGKSTLLRAAMARIPGLAFSVSATTREPRQGERDGVDYHFMERRQFDELVSEGAFIEHATVYERRYGTLRAPTEAALASGQSLLLDIDVQGAANVRAALPESVHLMILPPSLATLRARLEARGTDSAAIIEGRMGQVAQQLRAIGDYHYLIVNDDLSTAQATFQGVLLAEMRRRERNQSLVDEVLRQVGTAHNLSD